MRRAENDVISQRTILELEDLESSTSQQIKEAAQGCLDRIKAIHGDLYKSIRLDEEERRDRITQGWDGYMDHRAFMRYLDKIRQEAQANRNQLYWLASVITFMLLLAVAGIITVAIKASTYHPIYNCIAEGRHHAPDSSLYWLHLGVATWCIVAVSICWVAVLELRYRLFQIYKKSSKLSGTHATFRQGSQPELPVLRVFSALLISTASLFMLVVAGEQSKETSISEKFGAPVFSSSLVILGILLCSLAYKSSLKRLEAQNHRSLFQVVYTPSSSRCFHYNFDLLKCFKPRFRNLFALDEHSRNSDGEVSVEAQKMLSNRRAVENGEPLPSFLHLWDDEVDNHLQVAVKELVQHRLLVEKLNDKNANKRNVN